MSMDPINLYDYEARAKLTLSHDTWDFIDAGAMDEFTTRRNRSAFEDLTLRPRFLRDIGERDISTTVLGEKISMPVMVSPAGSHMVAHPDGELATARGAGLSDPLMVLSTSSPYSLDDVPEAAHGPLWSPPSHPNILVYGCPSSRPSFCVCHCPSIPPQTPPNWAVT